MSQQLPVTKTCANDLSFIALIDEVVWDGRSTSSEFGCTRSLHPHTFQQPHSHVHLETEVSDIRTFCFLEVRDQRPPNVIGELARSFLLPFRKHTFRVQRRKLFLDPILKLEV